MSVLKSKKTASRRRSGASWFRVGVVTALLLGAGSLYTPYPLQLAKFLWLKPAEPDPSDNNESQEAPIRNQAPPVPIVPDPSPQEPAEKEPSVYIWKNETRFSLPDVQLPPFPPALPERVEPGNYAHIATMGNGINITSNVNFSKGSTATRDRELRKAYRVNVSLELLLPQAAMGDDLLKANPRLPKVLPAYHELMSTARVSPWYHALYLHKQNRIRKNAGTLNRLLDRHNFYDTDTILEMKAPQTGRRVLWVQADMDVVSDGSDGDRLPTMPEKIRKSDNYQPSTSYFWRKRTKTPNPLLPTWEERLRKQREEKAPAATIDYTKRVISNLKLFSYLLAEYDPFIVIPLTFREGKDTPYRPLPGDYAVVIVDNRVFPAIVGDYGPNFKTGEASLRLAKEINPKASVYARPVSNLGVSYVIFPGTKEEENGPIDYPRMHRRCKELLQEIGGLGETARFMTIVDKLAPPEPKPEKTASPEEASRTGRSTPSAASPSKP